ncbi:MAG: hypothetical protein ACREFX_09130 [Opitutaceae bacterium]
MNPAPMFVAAALALIAPALAFAGDPAPTQSITPDGNRYRTPIPVNDPFPDGVYGADHGGSSLALAHPYAGPFGYTDRSRGQFVYTVAPFLPRNSEGVFGLDVWLEQEDAAGNWGPAGLNAGVCDAGVIYQPVNTPNPGPSPSYRFTWTYDAVALPPNTSFRVFAYVYIFNQGGGTQGDFPIESETAAIGTGMPADPPRIAWTASAGAVNPAQVAAGETYIVSADAQEDDGDLIAVSIDKNGQPFAYAGGGNGYSGNSQNPSSDPAGSVITYTAWAANADGERSPTLTWTVSVIGKSNQAPVASTDVTLPFYSEPFTPPTSGGSGTGGWQFCVVNATNWDGGASVYTGTNLGPSPGNSPGARWAPNWSPPHPGPFIFWVARDEDSGYNPSAAEGPYTLTVTPVSPVGAFDTVSPASLAAGAELAGSGWAADAQMGAPLSSVQVLIDGGSEGSFTAVPGGSRPDVQAANITWGAWSPKDLTDSGWSFEWTVPELAPGVHTATAVATDAVYNVSATLGTQSFVVEPLPPPPPPPPAPTLPPPAPSGGSSSGSNPPAQSPSSGSGSSGSGSPSPPSAEILRVRWAGSPSFLWTDPSGLAQTPWPVLTGPQPLDPAAGNVALPQPPTPGPAP